MGKKPKQSYRKYDLDTDVLDYSFSYNDDEATALHKQINNNAEIDLDDLRRIALWKIGRVLDVSENTIKRLRLLSRSKTLRIDDELVREIMDELLNSQGIGVPMASAILKFIRPDIFPIIDVRAYRALTQNGGSG